jgi:predicted deacylase
MAEAHRFQRSFIDTALLGIASSFAEFGVRPAKSVYQPDLQAIIKNASERAWLRANIGGLVDMHHEVGVVVQKGEPVCIITNPLKTDSEVVKSPFTGLLVEGLKHPLVYPGNPLCQLVQLDLPAEWALNDQ